MTTPSKAAPWECFQDASYYDMWCVRQAHDRTFGQGFHLVRGEEAEALTAMLNAQAARVAALLEALEHQTAFIEQNYNPLAVLPYNTGPARAAITKAKGAQS